MQFLADKTDNMDEIVGSFSLKNRYASLFLCLKLLILWTAGLECFFFLINISGFSKQTVACGLDQVCIDGKAMRKTMYKNDYNPDIVYTRGTQN